MCASIRLSNFSDSLFDRRVLSVFYVHGISFAPRLEIQVETAKIVSIYGEARSGSTRAKLKLSYLALAIKVLTVLPKCSRFHIQHLKFRLFTTNERRLSNLSFHLLK